MTNIITNDVPETVTVSCPLKKFQQRYICKGCFKCEFFKGVTPLTNALETEVRDKVTGVTTGMRLLEWHEKNMIICAYPMTRRCANMSIVED